MDLSLTDHLLASAAAVAAGLINAVAGGGTLVTFPTLVALGLPAVSSNITNTVALCPGYFGGTYAQRDDLRAQRRRVPAVVAAAAVGGLIGSTLLVISSEELFRAIVPFLLLGACALLAAGDWIKTRLPPRPNLDGEALGPLPRSVTGAVFIIGIYAGYFGAGMGIIALAVLGVALDGTMVQVNALKQFVAFTANLVAAGFFLFSGKVEFSLVLVMAPASLLGGSLGGRLVRRLNPWVLRAVVIGVGVVVAINFWFG
jgi:uncharacterized membrane protein YfcA